MQDNSLELAKQCNVYADIIKNRTRSTKAIDLLVQEVLSLNPKCNEIGEGKLNRLIELAKEVDGAQKIQRK